MSDKFGIIYVVFGEKAAVAAHKSIESLMALGKFYEISIVGDQHAQAVCQAKTCNYIQWTGASPYDALRQEQFQFRAGRVKPSLYDLSPYDKTLYVDADTEFQQDPGGGFDLLEHYEFMVAKHSAHTLGMLKMDAPGQERHTTTIELGGSGDIPYPNSGVIFWRKTRAVKQLFAAWSVEWLRFQDWDEQCALMRALFKHPVRMLTLPEAWNGENRKEGSIIFHDFHGQQVARSNVSAGNLPLAEIFTGIHASNYWKSAESKSGTGSEIQATERLRVWLPKILNMLGAQSILDAGCGDWNWASQIPLFGPEYLYMAYHGCDIVPELIKQNKARYPDRHFFVADLTCDPLPQDVQVILCRSVLFHLSFENVRKVIQNFQRTQAKWLLTTTYPHFLGPNDNIQNGRWHRINLTLPPFDWPQPELLMPEGAEPDGVLGLWKLDEVK